MKMFDIYYVNLSQNTINSEQGGIRPVVVIQNDIGNKYSPTVIVLPMTSEIKKLNMPTHCIVHKNENNGLKVNSMVLAEQIRVIDKTRLEEYIGYIDNIEEQNEIIKAYMANITGKKRYSSVWVKIINMFVRLVKEGEHVTA